MTVELIKGTLAWSAILNMGILLWWFLFLTCTHNWVYKMHSKFYEVSRQNLSRFIMSA